MGQGESNISKVSVDLPKSEQVDNAHIGTPCTRVQYAGNACPPSSQIGFARAETPLLGQPLEGPLISAPPHTSLPDIVADLNGQIHIDLDGRVNTTKHDAPSGPRLKGSRTRR